MMSVIDAAEAAAAAVPGEPAMLDAVRGDEHGLVGSCTRVPV